MAAADALTNGVNNLQLTDIKLKDDKIKAFTQQFGFSLDELYKIALRFFKEKDDKTLELSYNDKLRLVAYTKQVAHGKFADEVQPDVGFLDVVGSDRRQAWQALGDMPKETAMAEFVQYLDAKSSIFKSHVQDKKAEQEKMKRRDKRSEAVRKKEEEEKMARMAEEEEKRQQEIENQRQHDQEMQIRAALNQQTMRQFQKYVCEQYPTNGQLQEAMIEHLQEQYYQQYIQQSFQQQQEHQRQQQSQLERMHKEKQLAALGSSNTFALPVTNGVEESSTDPEDLTAGQASRYEGGDGDSPLALIPLHGSLPPMPELVPASMWFRKDLKDFKNGLKKNKENVICVSSLATATVRVPTHKDGTTLNWEFATDYYDIGFGLFFEWTISPGTTVSVHMSESSDDEEEYEEDVPVESKGDDIEKGGKPGSENKPPVDEIIPIYRRDSHEEVQCGSHVCPGKGVYLFKFDNTFSLWRSKYLYYRVWYSK